MIYAILPVAENTRRRSLGFPKGVRVLPFFGSVRGRRSGGSTDYSRRRRGRRTTTTTTTTATTTTTDGGRTGNESRSEWSMRGAHAVIRFHRRRRRRAPSVTHMLRTAAYEPGRPRPTPEIIVGIVVVLEGEKPTIITLSSPSPYNRRLLSLYCYYYYYCGSFIGMWMRYWYFSYLYIVRGRNFMILVSSLCGWTGL